MTHPLIVDGGLATELEARGYPLDPVLWSGGVFLEHPEAVESVHRAYLAAGANVVISASYQMSFEGLARAGHDKERARAVLRATVQVARRACAETRPRAIVAASVGPYGATLGDGSEYRGDYGLSVRELTAFHRERFELLAHTDADLLAIETLPSLVEARGLLGLLHTHPGARAWFSFACRDGRHLADGEPIERAAELLDGSSQVLAIGVNCTAPRFVSSLMERIRAVSSKPIVVYPNSGESWDAETRRWTGAAAREEFLRSAQDWARLGAWAIGGCCRVGPDWIRELVARLSDG